MHDPTAPETPSAGPVADSPARPAGPLGHRRSFLINKRYQLRVSFMTATVVLILLVFINLTLFSLTSKSSAEMLELAPEWEEMILSQDRIQFYMIILASVVFLVGVFVVSILETHKTAGAAYNLERRMTDVAGGRLTASLMLRKGDNLQELEVAFNRMARSLREHTWDSVESLEQLAADAEAIDAPRAAELATAIRELAGRERARVE